MKKIKWIMLAVVLCLGLVGGAYAYWTDTVTINGTVATAKMDVVFIAATATPGLYETASVNGQPSVASATKVLNFAIGNLYPRADYPAEDTGYTLLSFTIKNNGTIPVKIKSLTASGFGDGATILPRLNASMPGLTFGAGTLQASLDAVVADWGTQELAPRGERTYSTYVWLDDSVDDKNQGGKIATFTITAVIEQFNAPVAPVVPAP